MSLLDTILSGVGAFGNALDTPGAIVRNSLAGRNPFTGLNPFDAEGRASGRDVLETWGILDPNEAGLDFGDVAGFGAEMLTDPLNLLGANALRNIPRFANAAREANAASDAMRAAGAMPEEIAELTKIASKKGTPQLLYHGTQVDNPPSSFADLDPKYSGRSTDSGYYSRGVYSTPQERYARAYANWHPSYDGGEDVGTILKGYADIRNPFISNTIGRRDEFIATLPRDAQLEILGNLEAMGGWGDWVPSMDDVDHAYMQRLIDAGMDKDVAISMAHTPSPFDGSIPSTEITEALRSRGYDGVVVTDPGWDGSWNHPDGLSEVIAFDKSQLYPPVIAPRHQEIPTASPLLATLAGHNAMSGNSRIRNQ